jgi:hypothetical protein
VSAATSETLDEQIAAAAAYLHTAVNADGRFAYRIDALTGEEDHYRYNILRHAGSLLALGEYHQYSSPTTAQAAALQRVAGFMLECCLRSLEEAPQALAIWSDPELTGGQRDYPVAKLGGAGLALAALVQFETAIPGSVDQSVLTGLAEFIIFMQKRDGGFYSMYAAERGGRDDSWTSLYYPGEAALGLVMLFEIDSNPRWLKAAVDALRFLAREREDVIELPADHWALIATARLFSLDETTLSHAAPPGLPWRASAGPTLESALRRHAHAVVAQILSEQIDTEGSGCAQDGFNIDGRTTPTATRLEGLLAAWSLLPPGPDKHALHARMRPAMRFLRDAQLTTGPASGGFTRVAPKCRSSEPRANEVRIDYAQHALAAMLMYRDRFEP